MVYRTTPKMNARKEVRRRKLLGIAIRIFGRKGYHHTTVPMIVVAARSSIGSFYFYFRNKEDIFAAALREVGARISSTLNQAIAAAGPEVISQMEAAVKAFVWFLAEHREEARILLTESSGLGPNLEAVRDQLIASHTRSVEKALRAVDQQLPPMDPSIVANCWVGSVYQSVLHWLRQPARERSSPEALAAAVTQFNLRGIGAKRKSGH